MRTINSVGSEFSFKYMLIQYTVQSEGCMFPQITTVQHDSGYCHATIYRLITPV